jgi:hypothetical protein
MPILQTIPATTFFCKDCGWHITRPSGTRGDLLSPLDALLFVGVERCDECGSEQIAQRPANWSNWLNPLENVRWWAYYARQMRRKSK